MAEIIDIGGEWRVAMKNKEVGMVPLYEMLGADGGTSYESTRDVGAESCREKYFMWGSPQPGCLRLEEGKQGWMLPALCDSPDYVAPSFLREYICKARGDTAVVATPHSEQELLSFVGDSKREYHMSRTVCAVERVASKTAGMETQPLHRMYSAALGDSRLVIPSLIASVKGQGYTEKCVECHTFVEMHANTTELFLFFNDDTKDSSVAVLGTPEFDAMDARGYRKIHSLGFVYYNLRKAS